MIPLILKEFRLTKKYILPALVLSVLSPLLTSLGGTQIIANEIIFILTSFLAVSTQLLSAMMMDMKYPEAVQMLCSVPYRKRNIVISRYIAAAIVFLLTYSLFQLVAFLVPQINYLGIELVAIILTVGSLLLAAYLPLAYRFGFQKLQIIFAATVVIAPMVIMEYSQLFVEGFLKSHLIRLLFSLNPLTGIVIALVFSALVTAGSIIISISIFERKDF